MKLLNLFKKNVLGSVYGTDVLSDKIDATGLQSVSFGVSMTNSTPAGLDFLAAAVNTTDDTIDLDASALGTGVVGQFTTSGGLPSGISALTNYYLIKVSDTQVKVASSLANALAGTAINITTQGTGTHTFTATAFNNQTQVSVYGSNQESSGYEFVQGAPVGFTTTANVNIEVPEVTYNFYKVGVEIDSGTLTVNAYGLGKGMA